RMKFQCLYKLPKFKKEDLAPGPGNTLVSPAVPCMPGSQLKLGVLSLEFPAGLNTVYVDDTKTMPEFLDEDVPATFWGVFNHNYRDSAAQHFERVDMGAVVWES